MLRSFPPNLQDITTAQQENPLITRYILNKPKRFKLQNYNSDDSSFVIEPPVGDQRLCLLLSSSI
jgi:hypothetical protein